ncbi:response regulator transcription factor [Candidatus Woesebacteria bacterium]|jgi:DNA-binding response OmpR family regulator|nr:response regulator transcription factor [Candidatus Woesebacteria bacterium]
MKVLVIEDEHRIANSIKKGLEQEKYTVDVSYSGTDGFDLATTESYDVILLDVLLPEMDGFTICKKLREQHVHTPILMLTARGQIQDKITGLDNGADDYLTKPFAFEELLARVRALSRRPKISIQTVLRVADLELDSKLFEVKRAGKLIPLSNKEFMLLEYLVRNPNKILTKDQIIEHVWDYDSNILPNTIEVYIRNLRKKIDKPFNAKSSLLHTVRGFGYKIEG